MFIKVNELVDLIKMPTIINTNMIVECHNPGPGQSSIRMYGDAQLRRFELPFETLQQLIGCTDLRKNDGMFTLKEVFERTGR
jgi:hypothetical protein